MLGERHENKTKIKKLKNNLGLWIKKFHFKLKPNFFEYCPFKYAYKWIFITSFMISWCISYILLKEENVLKSYDHKGYHVVKWLITIFKFNFLFPYSELYCIHSILIDVTSVRGWVWLVQLVRSLLSDHKVPSLIPSSAEIQTFVQHFFLRLS